MWNCTKPISNKKLAIFTLIFPFLAHISYVSKNYVYDVHKYINCFHRCCNSKVGIRLHGRMFLYKSLHHIGAVVSKFKCLYIYIQIIGYNKQHIFLLLKIFFFFYKNALFDCPINRVKDIVTSLKTSLLQYCNNFRRRFIFHNFIFFLHIFCRHQLSIMLSI